MHEQIKFSGAQQATEAKKKSSTDFSKTNEVAVLKLCWQRGSPTFTEFNF